MSQNNFQISPVSFSAKNNFLTSTLFQEVVQASFHIDRAQVECDFSAATILGPKTNEN
jgi:hypothetical protein